MIVFSRCDLTFHVGSLSYYIYFWIDEEHRTVQITAVIYVMRDQPMQLEQMEME